MLVSESHTVNLTLRVLGRISIPRKPSVSEDDAYDAGLSLGL